jgi:hypothetical protein
VAISAVLVEKGSALARLEFESCLKQFFHKIPITLSHIHVDLNVDGREQSMVPTGDCSRTAQPNGSPSS